jgi:hypothetical protein
MANQIERANSISASQDQDRSVGIASYKHEANIVTWSLGFARPRRDSWVLGIRTVHYIISALGSSGDVHPMVGLGACLAQRGHRVTLLASVYFEPLITGAGLELVSADQPGEFEESVHDPDLWHPRRGPMLMRGLQAICFHAADKGHKKI